MPAPVDHCAFAQLKKQLEIQPVLGFVVATASMHPVISVGAKIMVMPLTSSPRLFDILVFWDGHEKLICHYFWHSSQLRIPGAQPTYTTRAMGGGEDLPIAPDRVLGLVASHRISRWQKLKIILRHWRISSR